MDCRSRRLDIRIDREADFGLVCEFGASSIAFRDGMETAIF